jgi:hypothetical protein
MGKDWLIRLLENEASADSVSPWAKLPLSQLISIQVQQKYGLQVKLFQIKPHKH